MTGHVQRPVDKRLANLTQPQIDLMLQRFALAHAPIKNKAKAERRLSRNAEKRRRREISKGYGGPAKTPKGTKERFK